jgi:hypothetical protein
VDRGSRHQSSEPGGRPFGQPYAISRTRRT